MHGTSYQARVTGVCAPGLTMQGINADGTVVCTALNGPPTITTVDDPANFVGYYTSLAIGTDGFPVISYHDQTAGTLKVAKCNDRACAGNNETITTVDDPANSVGEYTSIAIGTDGFPVISYFDATAGALKVAKCNDAACAGDNETITTVDDPANHVGYYTSIAIGTDGFPVISYHDASAGALKVAKCNDAACAGNNETITTVDDPANGVGYYTSIAIGTDGFPVISYHDATAAPQGRQVQRRRLRRQQRDHHHRRRPGQRRRAVHLARHRHRRLPGHQLLRRHRRSTQGRQVQRRRLRRQQRDDHHRRRPGQLRRRVHLDRHRHRRLPGHQLL